MEMQDTEMIDFELWLISMIRVICQREACAYPASRGPMSCSTSDYRCNVRSDSAAGARPPHVNFPTTRASRESPRLPASIKRVIADVR